MASLLDRNSAGEDAYALLEEADVEIGRLRARIDGANPARNASRREDYADAVRSLRRCAFVDAAKVARKAADDWLAAKRKGEEIPAPLSDYIVYAIQHMSD